jgi:hypothetical protein
MAYKMTAARRAALRKAQLASARKRRRGGKAKPAKNKRNLRNLAAEDRRRTEYMKKNYRGPGAIHKAYRDYGRSQGAYKNNAYGNRVSRPRRVARRAIHASMYTSPISSTMLVGSYARGVRKGTIAKPRVIKKAKGRAKAASRTVRRTAKKAWG